MKQGKECDWVSDYYCVCVHVAGAHMAARVEMSEDNFVELLFSFHLYVASRD